MIRTRSPWITYPATLGMVALTLGFGLLIQLLGVQSPATIFVIPVALAAWWGGLGPGLLATIAGAALYNIFLSQPFGDLSTHPDDVVRVAALLFVALFVTAIDAARHRLEARAIRSNEEMNQILMGSADGITVQNPAGTLIFANYMGAHIVGYPTPQALLKAPIAEVMSQFELFDEAGKPLPLTALPSRRALAGETPEPLIVRFRVKGTEEEHWSIVRSTPILDDQGALRFVVNNFQDITPIKMAEAQASEQRERFEVTLSSIGDAVIATDAQGRVTFMNRIAETLTGWSSSDALGKPLPEVFEIVDEASRQPSENPVEVALREDRVVELSNSTVLRRKNGGEIPIDDSAAPIRDDAGTVSGVVLVFRDVTAKKQRAAVQRFVADVGKAFSASIDLDLTMQIIGEMIVPDISDWCTIDLLDQNGRLYEAALVHSDLGKQRRVHDMRMGGLQADPQVGLTTQVAKSGQPLIWSDYSEETIRRAGWSEEDMRLLLELDMKSTMLLPLKVLNEVIGVMTLTTAESGRIWQPEDIALGEQIADRAAVAIQNARLYREIESERERLRTTLASIGDAVIATDKRGRVVFMNHVAQTLTGWTQQEATLKPLDEVFVIINEYTRESVESPVNKVLREGKIVGLANHTLLIARDGTEVPIDDSGAPIRDGEGDLMGVILVFRDINERKAQEKEIGRLAAAAETERKRLDEIVKSIPGVVWEAWGEPDASNQRMNFVSGYVEEMLGYAQEEWLGTPNFWLTIVHPDDKEGAAQRSRQTFEGTGAGVNQFRWIRKNGEVIWVETHSQPIIDAEGKRTGMRGVTMDISERKRAEELLQQQNEMIEIVNRVGQTLAAELDLEKLLQTLTDAATALTGAQFGSFFYNVVDSKGESYMLYTLSGVPREKFSSFPNPRNTEVFHPTFSGEAIVRSDDITQDPRYGKNPPYHGKPEGHLPVRSYLAAPVKSRTGEVIGGLFFGHEEVGVFGEHEERLLVGLAAQAAVAIDNARLYSDVREQRERLSVTLASIGDAVIATNTVGKITFMNPVAERLTGWSAAEAANQPIETIFNTIYEPTGEAAPNPVAEVLATGEIVHLANHTVLITRDGREVPIEDSGAPIRDPEGKVIGVILVFRDVSERKRSERALRESELRFRTIFEQAAVGIAQTTIEGKWIGFNARMHEMLGYSYHELMATQGFREVTDPDDYEEDHQHMQRVLNGEMVSYHREKRYLRKDGSVMWAMVTVTLVRDDNQQPLYWIGVIEDITERRRMEAAVHDSESQLRLITNSIPALVSYVGADQHYRFNNRAYEEWFGHSAEEVQGKMMEEVLGAEAMEGLRPYVERALSGETVRFESSIPYKDAGLRHISAAYVPDIGPDGKVRGFFALVSDISERRAMELALLESEQQFRKVANSAPVMLWMTDETAQGTFLNASWLEYTGQTLEQGLGTGWLNAIHPEDRPIVDEVFSRAFAKREAYTLEYRLRRPDGAYRWNIDRGVALYDGDGRFTGYIGSVTDIDDRKRAEDIQEFMAQVGEVLGSSLDYEDTLASVARLAVPRMADWAAIDLLGEDSSINRVAVAHRDPAKLDLFWQLWEQVRPTIDEPSGTGKVIRTGEPQVYFDVPEALIDQRYEEPIRGIVKGLGLRAGIIMPLIINGKPIGSLTLTMAESGRGINEADIDAAQELARRASTAIDRARLYRDIREQRERLAVTLASIGDAVIATDAQGRVTFINAVAEGLTGWSQDDAAGEPLERVFHIVNEQTGELAVSPVAKVLRTGEIVGLANHTALVARDGTHIPIDDSGAPIRSADGEVIGVILVFRDIRERKAAEQQRELYAHEQEFIAAFGQRALAGADFETLLEEGTEGTASVLGVEYAKVLELMPDGTSLLLRAGVGWHEGLIGTRKVDAGTGSHGGYTLLSSQPVIVDDLRTDTRFSEPMLNEHEVISGVSTIIRGPGGEPWGTLGVHTTRHRKFTQDDIHFLQAIANILAESLQRSEGEQRRDLYARQQAVIAELGQKALAGMDIQALMEEAAVTMCATIDVDYCKVLELLSGGEDLLLRAGHGWHDGLVGLRRVSAGTGSHAGYTMLSKQPVILDDLRTETRFTEPLLTEHNVISGMSVLIEGSNGMMWGVLGAHTVAHRRFSQDDINFLQAVANILAEALQRKQAREDLERSLDRTRDLYEISRQIGSQDTPQEILEVLVSSPTLKNVARATIAHFSSPWNETPPESTELVAEWLRDSSRPGYLGQQFLLKEYDLARFVSRTEPVIIGDVATDSRLSEASRTFSLAMGIRSYILFPLVASGQWFGTLSIQWEVPYVAGEMEARHFQGLVDQAAAAIYNLRLLETEARARRAAERADALKMKFLAMISHELRTPLTSIKGFTTTLLAEDVDWENTDQREFLTIVNEEADNLTDLIEQLLDLSRLEAGALTIQMKLQSLNDILAQAMPHLYIVAAQHQLEVDMPLNLPMVNADGRRISQVITNIVTNAVKYSLEDTAIRISAEIKEQFVQINIRDQGRGIPPDEHESVFEAFRQAENRPPEETKGAGLGLAISRGLIEAHGGQIWISNSDIGGTTVSFTLPIVDPPT